MKYRLDKPSLDLNLAPMIDVVFLLLIFFIVASSLNVKEVETNINLAETGVDNEQRNAEIVIAITEKGKMYIDEKEVPVNKLEGFLKMRLKNNNANISIYADKKVAFQEVVKVMDIVKKLKVKNLSFVLHRKN
ncbi:biopolymer transporter ExbD [Halocella sp. SP3-1]|uniref:ExbD/TolR family protein n=1 Tax=Halocella sp. SP3-1 TaxID=2382161 RepID=UPI000F751286|nr:biopolymer transporter ExbD [Halocella sp. SP3-1]AZO94699.1 biopolymer transporter ExbD [Halocella sp. SP3-1]